MKRNVIIAVVFAAACACVARADSTWPVDGASMFADNKAYTIGDVVTVIVQEESSVTNNIGSNLAKTTSTVGEIQTIDFPGTQIFPADERPKVEFDSARTFTGAGSYALADTMETSLTSVVVDVLPNGNLVIEGSRQRQSVDEKINIRISGIVRPADIRSDNTVLSSSIAQARIVLESSGPNHRSTRRGFLNRVVDFIWPF